MSEYDDYLAKYGGSDPRRRSYGILEFSRADGRRSHPRQQYSRQDSATVPERSSLRHSRAVRSILPRVCAQAPSKHKSNIRRPDANTANEEDIKQGYKSRRERALRRSAKSRTTRPTRLIAGSTTQPRRRGIRPMRRESGKPRFDDDAAGHRTRAGEGMAAAGDVKAQREVSYDTQLAGDELAFKERVQNNYPNVVEICWKSPNSKAKGRSSSIDPNAFGGGIGGFGGV